MRSKIFAPLILTVSFLGCAENPADSVPNVTATPPKNVAPAQPTEPTPGAVDPTITAKAGALVATAVTDAGLAFSSQGSKIDFVGSKVTGSHKGGFKAFNGAIELGPDAKTIQKITAEIEMTSLWADNDSLTTHLKAPDFFNVATYPKSNFVTTEIKEGGDKGATHTITGNLDLHGVNKSITFPATVTVAPDAVTLISEFALNRFDFGIVTPGKSDDLIRKEVVLKLDINAAKPKS